MEVVTRWVHVVGVTANPAGEWTTTQQACEQLSIEIGCARRRIGGRAAMPPKDMTILDHGDVASQRKAS